MFRGLEGYKADANLGKSFSQVLAPFQPMLAQTNTDPARLTQEFLSTHVRLLNSTPEQKVQEIMNIAKMYGIELPAGQPDPNAPYLDPEVKALRDELASVKSQLSGQAQQQARIQAAEQERIRASLNAEINAFAADPANVYFNDVANDIATLLKSGAAKDLKDAYQQAIWLNPATRAKELDREATARAAAAQEEARKKAEDAAKATAANVRTKAKQASGTAALGSIDDTLKETLAAIKSRA